MSSTQSFEGLIPFPGKVKTLEGSFIIDTKNTYGIKVADSIATKMDVICAQLLELGFMLDLKNGANEIISVLKDESLLAESYKLTILPNKISISAFDEAGVFYAFQTLRQLIMSGNGALQCCEIEDSPHCKWRGFMLDTSRCFYPVQFVKKIIDIIAFHKLNIFHWHITDDQGWRLAVKEYPMLTKIGGFNVSTDSPPTPKKGGFYSEDEIKDVIQFASERHITIVPEIDVPGHTSAVLAAYPGLGCIGGPYQVQGGAGVFDDVLCMGEEDVFVLLEKVFETVCRLFPGQYVHIGGDECPRTRWAACPKCKKKMDQEGIEKVEEIQPWFTAKISNMLTKYGKTVIGWDEVLDGSEKTGLPKDLIVQSWQGVTGGEKAVTKGNRVIMSPLTDGCYLNFKHSDDPLEAGRLDITSVEKSYNFNPVPDLALKDLYIGGQANFWSEEIHSAKMAEYMIFPRLCAISECLWLERNKKDFESFASRLQIHKKRLDLLDILYYRGPLK